MATRVTEVIVPLRNWLAIEAAAKPSSIDRSNKESFIRRTTVAYGIAELLKRTDVTKIDEYARIDNIVLKNFRKLSLQYECVIKRIIDTFRM